MLTGRPSVPAILHLSTSISPTRTALNRSRWTSTSLTSSKNSGALSPWFPWAARPGPPARTGCPGRTPAADDPRRRHSHGRSDGPGAACGLNGRPDAAVVFTIGGERPTDEEEAYASMDYVFRMASFREWSSKTPSPPPRSLRRLLGPAPFRRVPRFARPGWGKRHGCLAWR